MKVKLGVGTFIILGVALMALLILNPFVTVGAGERAVLFSLYGGTLSRQLGEGTHLIMPVVQRPIFYDVRSQTYSMSETTWEGEVHGDDSLSALTSDGQTVKVEISLRFRPDPEKIYQLHQQLGTDYVNKLIRPEVRSKVRVAISEFPINDVFSEKREVIQKRIRDSLVASLSQNDILVDDVLLRNITFSQAYAAAIVQKQIAQQNAQRMQYVLQKAELDKQQKILEAQGEARAINLKGRAIAQNARLVQYEFAQKIAPNVSMIVTDGKTVSVPAPRAGR